MPDAAGKWVPGAPAAPTAHHALARHRLRIVPLTATRPVRGFKVVGYFLGMLPVLGSPPPPWAFISIQSCRAMA